MRERQGCQPLLADVLDAISASLSLAAGTRIPAAAGVQVPVSSSWASALPTWEVDRRTARPAQ
jgi:hypothetical protein